jgi:hypothetical protein
MKNNHLFYPLAIMLMFILFANSCKKEEVSDPTPSIKVPVLTTSAVTAITSTSVTTGGFITSDGGAKVSAHGVCWSTGTTPIITNDKTNDGPGIGIFNSAITGLSPNTKYYVRAYATNSVGTSYGNVISFTTKSIVNQVPVLTTTTTSSVKSTSAKSGGNITSDGGAAVTIRGVCWSKVTNPTITDSITKDGTGSGSFSSSIKGLNFNTTYYVRAYATNSTGTGYGNEINFTTSLLELGDSFQGGIVAYILQSGDSGYISGQIHGLIAAPTDLSTGIQWYNGSAITTGATGTSLGTGKANTDSIVKNQGAGSYAAKLCSDLVLGGYSDWYLPSKDELFMLYTNRALISGFATGNYWSSSEYSIISTWYVDFTDGTLKYSINKAETNHVRAVRSF